MVMVSDPSMSRPFQLLYTVLSTIINMSVVICAGYPLSAYQQKCSSASKAITWLAIQLVVHSCTENAYMSQAQMGIDGDKGIAKVCIHHPCGQRFA